MSGESGRVTFENDVVFGTGGGRELKCNVYRPPEQRSDAASVLLVHGGAWVIGDNRCCGLYSSVGAFLASQGIGAVQGGRLLCGRLVGRLVR